MVDSSELLEASPEDGLEIEGALRSLSFLFKPVETLLACLASPWVRPHFLPCVRRRESRRLLTLECFLSVLLDKFHSSSSSLEIRFLLGGVG